MKKLQFIPHITAYAKQISPASSDSIVHNNNSDISKNLQKIKVMINFYKDENLLSYYKILSPVLANIWSDKPANDINNYNIEIRGLLQAIIVADTTSKKDYSNVAYISCLADLENKFDLESKELMLTLIDKYLTKIVAYNNNESALFPEIVDVGYIKLYSSSNFLDSEKDIISAIIKYVKSESIKFYDNFSLQLATYFNCMEVTDKNIFNISLLAQAVAKKISLSTDLPSMLIDLLNKMSEKSNLEDSAPNLVEVINNILLTKDNEWLERPYNYMLFFTVMNNHSQTLAVDVQQIARKLLERYISAFEDKKLNLTYFASNIATYQFFSLFDINDLESQKVLLLFLYKIIYRYENEKDDNYIAIIQQMPVNSLKRAPVFIEDNNRIIDGASIALYSSYIQDNVAERHGFIPTIKKKVAANKILAAFKSRTTIMLGPIFYHKISAYCNFFLLLGAAVISLGITLYLLAAINIFVKIPYAALINTLLFSGLTSFLVPGALLTTLLTIYYLHERFFTANIEPCSEYNSCDKLGLTMEKNFFGASYIASCNLANSSSQSNTSQMAVQ